MKVKIEAGYTGDKEAKAVEEWEEMMAKRRSKGFILPIFLSRKSDEGEKRRGYEISSGKKLIMIKRIQNKL